MCLYSSLYSSRASSCVTTKQEANSSSIKTKQEANSSSITTKQEEMLVNSSSITTEKEANSSSLSVRDRTTGDVRQLSIEDFVREIKNAVNGKPVSKLNSAILLSQRPQIMV